MENQVRNKLINVLEDHGVKLTFIAKKLGWNYKNLISWKNCNREYSIKRLRKLDEFLGRYN